MNKRSFEKAVNGGKYAYIIWQLDHYLRANTKYAPDSMPDEVHKAYEEQETSCIRY
jgi:hypothetical protein